MLTLDLRSDTLTKPSIGMREAMYAAPLGDDVFGEDPTVNALEEKIATLFGKEAALFCPSGTMTNQIAIRLHTGPQKEVICHQYSHIYLYEGGGMAWIELATAHPFLTHVAESIRYQRTGAQSPKQQLLQRV